MSTNMGLVTAYLFFLPRIIAASGIDSAFLVLVGLGVVGLLALPYFPSAIERKSAAPRSAAKVRPRGFSAGAVLGLAGCLGLNTGVGMVWPFMGALGSARGISSEAIRSEEHTSELQSLMRISYAVFCLQKKKKKKQHT